MIEEVGVVSKVEGGQVWVDIALKSTCSACQANESCGTGVVAKAFSHKTESLVLRTERALEVGQKVKVGVAEMAMLKTSALVYLVPLLVFVLSAALFELWLFPLLALKSEILLVLASFICAGISVLTIKKLLKNNHQWKLEPELLSVVPEKQINVVQLD